MMDDLISRKAARRIIEDIDTFVSGWRYLALEQIDELPTAEKKGEWEEKQDNEWAGGGAWVCSECGFGYAFGAYHEAFEFNYCPNCGARMEESDGCAD